MYSALIAVLTVINLQPYLLCCRSACLESATHISLHQMECVETFKRILKAELFMDAFCESE